MNIEEYQNTFNILKQQKYLLNNKLKEKDVENLKTIIENIIYIDKKLNEYDLIISNKSNINNINLKTTKINNDSYKNEEIHNSNQKKRNSII